MTTRYERRIRHLEGRHMPTGANAVVLGLSGTQPTAEEIDRASLVLRIAFVSAKDGRLVEGGSYAQH
jgi:hypothetical protein